MAEVIDFFAGGREDGRKCRECGCFANKKGICEALSDTDFGGRECPFFKTKEDAETERLDALERLVEKKRFDLIEKYRGTLEELGVLSCGDSFFDDHGGTVSYLAELKELEQKLKEGGIDPASDEAADEWDGWYEDGLDEDDDNPDDCNPDGQDDTEPPSEDREDSTEEPEEGGNGSI